MYINGYALALFSLAQEENKLIQYKSDSQEIVEAFEQNIEFISILNTKSIPIEERQDLVTKALGKKTNKNIVNFIYILIERSKANILIPALKKLIKLINVEKGIDEGVVYSTTPLSKTELSKVIKKTSDMLGKKVTLVNKIDKELISGIRIIVQDEIIEDNISSRFEQMKNELLNRKDN